MSYSKEQKMIGQVIEKAWNDPSFKAELIAAPMQAFEKVTGERLPLPDGVQLQVQDQSDTSIAFLNIPPKPDLDSLELTDEQLEMVAGGDITLTAALTWIVGAGIVSFVGGYINNSY